MATIELAHGRVVQVDDADVLGGSDMSTADNVPAGTWTDGASRRSLVVEETNPGDIVVEFWVADPSDGPSVLLSTTKVRQLYDALGDRLALLEGHR